jgi:hypothetical protein
MPEIHVRIDQELYQTLKRLLDTHNWTWGDFFRASILLHAKQDASRDSRQAKARPARKSARPVSS